MFEEQTERAVLKSNISQNGHRAGPFSHRTSLCLISYVAVDCDNCLLLTSIFVFPRMLFCSVFSSLPAVLKGLIGQTGTARSCTYNDKMNDRMSTAVKLKSTDGASYTAAPADALPAVRQRKNSYTFLSKKASVLTNPYLQSVHRLSKPQGEVRRSRH